MEYREFCEKLNIEFKEKIGIMLSEEKCQSFFDFMSLLLEKNKVLNLTAITEPNDVIVRHFVDSCIPLSFKNEDNGFGKDAKMYFDGKKVIDVGTGAGFPGLPLAIVCDKATFLLSDTLGKRINFLSEVLDKIQLKNVELVKARAEDLAFDSSYREMFDYCTSRGVAKIAVLSEYSLPFVKIGGKMIAYKMNDCENELAEGKKAISELGGMFHVKHTYTLLSDEPKRCLLEIEKIKNTSKKYPRKAGTPSKQPIM